MEITKAIEEVRANPNFKKYGFTVDIRSNGEIVLKVNGPVGPFARKVSHRDSKDILNLIKISLENEKD